MSSKSMCFAEFLKKVVFQRECQAPSPLGRNYSSTYAHGLAASARVRDCLPRGTRRSHLTRRSSPRMFSAWQIRVLWPTLFIITRNRAGKNLRMCHFPSITHRDIEQNRL